MNPTQTQQCITELTGSFTDWKPSAKEVNNWSMLIAPYDFQRVMAALGKLWREKSAYKAPSPKLFRGIIAAEQIGGEAQATMAQPNAHLICHALDDNGKGLVGMLQSLGWTSTLVPMYSRPETQAAIDTNQKAYGGRWLSFCGRGIDARLKANEYRRELRAKAPVPTPAAPPEPAKLPPDISTVGQILAGSIPTRPTKPLQIDTIGDGDFEPAEEIFSEPDDFDGNRLMNEDDDKSIPF